MNAQEIISSMYEAEREAFDSWNEEWEAFVAENGEEPNWDDHIIYFEGKKASWFCGGDASRWHETEGMLRFSMSTMEQDSEAVERSVQDYLSGEW